MYFQCVAPVSMSTALRRAHTLASHVVPVGPRSAEGVVADSAASASHSMRRFRLLHAGSRRFSIGSVERGWRLDSLESQELRPEVSPASSSSSPHSPPRQGPLQQRVSSIAASPPVPPSSRVGLTYTPEDKIDVPSRRRARVSWNQPLRQVLLIKKWRDENVRRVAVDIAKWLVARNVSVLVENDELRHYEGVDHVSALDTETAQNVVDLVISLGGDGTFLHAARLFRYLECGQSDLLPPCLVLGAGSLGFLATVDASAWEIALESTLQGHREPVPCTLRTRLRCKLKDARRETQRLWFALNECVVQPRGDAIGKLQLWVDDHFVTLVEGDGLIISSPTGSTGYSLSCGGPIVSPSVPGTILTPIAPASLSFRPVVISEHSRIELVLPVAARVKKASVIIDGRRMGNLQPGGSVYVDVARPVPVLNVANLDKDWFGAITTKLKWNARDVEQADSDVERQSAHSD
eukprot:TRINITY_DN27402_c0_g1_i2.p1 TRINITY_DN27402_c0_g1~~TRINITY_DN27402_c0_g1_i2.p1  ORF type:complete len:464 (+),score=54.11 TRINITY_DN27402_c0_g1_i2:39-1430(+)